MMEPYLLGIISMLTVTLLFFSRRKPSTPEEWIRYAYLATIAFLDVFFISLILPFFWALATKFLFHLILYLTFVSLTVVFYASYKDIEDVRVLSAASVQWVILFVLILITFVLGLESPFFF